MCTSIINWGFFFYFRQMYIYVGICTGEKKIFTE